VKITLDFFMLDAEKIYENTQSGMESCHSLYQAAIT
jgi:hypothetical protein